MRREVLYSASLHVALFFGVYVTATMVDKPKPRSIKPIQVKFIGKRVVKKPTKKVRPTKKPTKWTKPSLSRTGVYRPPVTKKATRKPTVRPRPVTRRPVASKRPTRKRPTRRATPIRTVTKSPRPTPIAPKFGNSLADRVKAAWGKTPKPTQAPTRAPTVATTRPSLALPTLPPVQTSAPLTLAQVPSGMRVSGKVYSSDAWYLEEVKSLLDNNWIRPARVRGEERCEVSFLVARDGTIVASSLSSPSSNQSFNRSVLAAVQRVGKFKKLPKGIGGKSGERFFLTFVLSSFN